MRLLACLIVAPQRATMSQQSSLTQSAHSVRQVLTAYTVTTAWFLRMIQRAGVAAKLPFPVHPHMLRHSTGYKLANDGQDNSITCALSRTSQSAINSEIHCACA